MHQYVDNEEHDAKKLKRPPIKPQFQVHNYMDIGILWSCHHCTTALLIYYKLWWCLTRSGNYLIHKCDWLKLTWTMD